VPAVVSWALFAVAEKTSSGLEPYDPGVPPASRLQLTFSPAFVPPPPAAALLALAFRYYVCPSLQPPPTAQTQTPFRTPRSSSPFTRPPITCHRTAHYLVLPYVMSVARILAVVKPSAVAEGAPAYVKQDNGVGA